MTSCGMKANAEQDCGKPAVTCEGELVSPLCFFGSLISALLRPAVRSFCNVLQICG